MSQRHEVFFTVPERPLGRADIVFAVWRGDERLGDLLVSHGALDWRPVNQQYRHRVKWQEFAQFAKEKGRRV